MNVHTYTACIELPITNLFKGPNRLKCEKMATFNLSHQRYICYYTRSNNTKCHNCINFGLPSLCFKNPIILHRKLHSSVGESKIAVALSAMASGSVKEVRPPALDSSSDPPAIFDGIPKLYISYSCPYAQRVWITRNCKGLQDKIKLVPIDLSNRPSWYKEKVYHENKVPALEHNNQVKGESLDLSRYIDSNFDGPSLFPSDPAKIEFAEELLSFTNSFYKAVTTSLKEDKMDKAGAAFDDVETALSKFDDGPFFLGQFSLVDIAHAPFIERFQPFFLEVKNFDITNSRPRLGVWIEEMDKIEAYRQTQRDAKEHVESYKRRFSI